MIRFTVLWTPGAENELAAIWSAQPNRQEISRASDRFDAELQEDAHQKGFWLSKRLRTITFSPLDFYFQVDD
jgi:hypothetical protein